MEPAYRTQRSEQPEPGWSAVSLIPLFYSTVTVTDINGCVNTDIVQVNAIGELVDFPPHSHPNGDG